MMLESITCEAFAVCCIFCRISWRWLNPLPIDMYVGIERRRLAEQFLLRVGYGKTISCESSFVVQIY